MAIKRTATAHWEGSGKDGNGALSTQSTILNNTTYGFKSRFEEGPGTNPEELIAAAHAGCFSMKLAFNLQAAGFTASAIETKATVILDNGTITDIELHTEASVAGITSEKFDELILDAKANCPVSKVLNANIHLTYSLK